MIQKIILGYNAQNEDELYFVKIFSGKISLSANVKLVFNDTGYSIKGFGTGIRKAEVEITSLLVSTSDSNVSDLSLNYRSRSKPSNLQTHTSSILALLLRL